MLYTYLLRLYNDSVDLVRLTGVVDRQGRPQPAVLPKTRFAKITRLSLKRKREGKV
jgi:hypothetical protein